MKINLSKVIQYLPLLAPLPEGYAVYLAMEIMQWDEVFRVIAAVIVAGTGFWGVQVMNAMAEYNATLRRGEYKEVGVLPTWKAMVVLGVWFVGVTLLTVFLDVFPALQTWTPLGLVVVGFSAAYLFNLSNLHETREQERVAYRQKVERKKEADDQEKKVERKERKEKQQAIANKKQEIAARMDKLGTRLQVKGGSKLSDATLLLYWSEDPTLNSEGMAKKLMEDGIVDKISRQAIDQRTKKMIEKGLIIKTASGEVRERIFEDAAGTGGAGSGA